MSGKAGPSHLGQDESDGSEKQESLHRRAIVEGPTTILSWITVFPFRGAQVFDRITGARAMAVMPLAGIAIGAATALFLAPLLVVGVAPILVAALAVTSYQLLARMMHLDGLADVGDALGSYAEPARAQEILADKYTGALGMGAVLLTVLCQVSGLTACFSTSAWPLSLLTVILAPAIARLSAMIGCHRSFSPFSPTGFGSLIIGTVRTRTITLWTSALWASSVLAALIPYTHFSAYYVGVACAVSIAGALTASVVLARHMNHRFSGLNGDCVGALIEVSTAVSAVCFAVSATALTI